MESAVARLLPKTPGEKTPHPFARNAPLLLSDSGRKNIQSALNTVFSDRRISGLLKSKSTFLGGNVSVTTRSCTVYDVLSRYRNREAAPNGLSPEEALRSLVGNGREHGRLQLGFETMLSSNSHRVISAMQEVRREIRPGKNPELCREDF